MDGVPCLTQRAHNTYRADELTPARAQRLMALTESEGDWLSALSIVLAELNPAEAEYLERYVCSVDRSLALELVEFDHNSIVLDHGCGWGAMASAAAARAGGVVAMDLVAHRARFTASRCRQNGHEQVTPVVAGDEVTLPFVNEAFDVAVLNGVLEWVPTVVPGDPAQVQLSRLQEIARVLKPGGRLLLAIENRFWWRYFLGNGEVHTGRPWVSLMPRALVRTLTRRLPGGEFRTFTYSLPGYGRLLSRAGFSVVESRLALPDYNFPRELLDATDRSSIRARYRSLPSPRPSERIEHVLASLGILAPFAYCYVFVARKEPCT